MVGWFFLQFFKKFFPWLFLAGGLKLKNIYINTFYYLFDEDFLFTGDANAQF